jgi:hypothetical protein
MSAIATFGVSGGGAGSALGGVVLVVVVGAVGIGFCAGARFGCTVGVTVAFPHAVKPSALPHAVKTIANLRTS